MDDSASATLEEGHEHHRAGRLKEAHDVYKVVVTNEPENAAAHYLLGTLYMQGGNNELAVDLLAKAVDLEGGNQEYRCNLGTALLQVGRLEEGLGLLKETLEAEPDHLLAHTNLAHAYAESGDTVLAENHLKAIIRIDSRNARAYGDMGVIMAKRGAFDRALENFRRALDLQPGDPDFQINLANALQSPALSSSRCSLTSNPLLMVAVTAGTSNGEPNRIAPMILPCEITSLR